MSGRNLSGKYSICRIVIEDGSDALNYQTVVWGYDTEEEAVAAATQVAKKNGIDLSDLAVIGAIFPTLM